MRAPAKAAIAHATFASAFVLGALYYWFAVADRYVIFLYGHLDATPFDAETTSRYWMAALVASGGLMVLYALLSWVAGRVARLRGLAYDPPGWREVWPLCALPLAAGTLAITMCCNQPTLPLGVALCCAVAALAGTALALMPGRLAALAPVRLAWVGLWALGLLPALVWLRVVELPARTSVSPPVARAIAVGSVLAGTLWLALGAWWQARRGGSRIGARALLAAALGQGFALLPLAHHLFFAPAAYRYITSASNLFATGAGLQVLSLAVAALQAAGFAWLQDRWQRSRP